LTIEEIDMSTRKISKAHTACATPQAGTVHVTVRDSTSEAPLVGATIRLFQGFDDQGVPLQTCGDAQMVNWDPCKHHEWATGTTGPSGHVTFPNVTPGVYFALFDHVTPFSDNALLVHCVRVTEGTVHRICFDLGINALIALTFEGTTPNSCTDDPFVGSCAVVDVTFQGMDKVLCDEVVLEVDNAWKPRPGQSYSAAQLIRRPGRHPFDAQLLFARRSNTAPAGGAAGVAGAAGAAAPGTAALTPPPPGGAAALALNTFFDATERVPQPVSGNIGVSLSRTETEPTEDLSLWTLIRNSTEALSFNNYLDFLDQLFCTPSGDSAATPFERARFPAKTAAYNSLKGRRALPFTDSESYRVLKAATEAFVMVNCGVLRAPFAFDPCNQWAARRCCRTWPSFAASFPTCRSS
jgi:hypothetical protein